MLIIFWLVSLHFNISSAVLLKRERTQTTKNNEFAQKSDTHLVLTTKRKMEMVLTGITCAKL